MTVKTSLFEPDNFSGDWYGWATNQISHVFLGVLVSFLCCLAAFFVIGELPVKEHVLLAVFVCYAGFEVIAQRWNGLDTVEDTVFVVGYGASGSLAAFSEAARGSADVSVDLVVLVPFFAVCCTHLLAGSLHRMRAK